MARDTESSANLQKYGVPFYGAAWAPYDHVRSKLSSDEKQEKEDDGDGDGDKSPPASNYVVLAGGGGEGRSGIPNAIVLSLVDFAANSLSNEPVKFGTGSDLPYRMTVHPRGDGVICAMQQHCRLFEWKELEDNEVHKLGLSASEKVLTDLEDVGQQLALKFNRDGSVLAAGSEDGNLRVFKWPSMEIIINEAQAHSSVKDLDFSCDGKFLVSLGSGLCRIWDLSSAAAVASLPKENDEIFAFCRFSQINDTNEVLYIAAVTDRGASILTCNTSTWKRIRSKRIIKEPISAFNVSPDGRFLSLGTVQGDIFIIESTSMRVQTIVKKAHLGLVTALTFSYDSRALVSASLDSSARMTLIEHKKKTGGINLSLVLLIILLAIALYYMKDKGIISW